MSPYQGSDDTALTAQVQDLSGGMNNRQHASVIKPNQCALLYNADMAVPGETAKRPGIDLIEDLGDGNPGIGCVGFNPVEDTNPNELLVWHGQKMEGGAVTGSTLDTFVTHKSDIPTSGEQTTAFQAFRSSHGSCILFKNTTDNWMQYDPNDSPKVTVLTDSGNTNPPKEATIGCFFRGRVWLVGNNFAWFSDAYDDDYGTSFDQSTNAFNIPIGRERAAVPVRDTGIIFLGSECVYGLNPSMTPVATDQPEKLLDIGCVAGKTAQQVGDDVYFLAPDGVRGVFRTQQDKLQLTQSFPISYVLKNEYDSINWAYINKATAIAFDNKYFIALPTGSASYNNQVWVYYPSLQSWTVITGWDVGDWDIVNVNGEEKMYYIDSVTDKVYRAWTGTDDDGTAISLLLDSRKEDMGQPLRTKCGGEIEVYTLAAGNGNVLTVSVSVDEGVFNILGTINLTSGTAPVLPISLPFTLADTYIIRKKFHLDRLGPWRTLQVHIENTDLNTDPIKIFGYSIIALPEEYYGE